MFKRDWVHVCDVQECSILGSVWAVVSLKFAIDRNAVNVPFAKAKIIETSKY